MNKKRKINTKKIIATFLIVFLFSYFIYVFILLLNNSEATVIIENGTVSQMESVVGYILRDEVVIENNDDLTISKIKSDGEKTAKNEVVYKYENEQMKQIKDTIEELDIQINQRLSEIEEISLSSKIYDNQIEDLIYELSDKNTISENEKLKSQIDKLLYQRIKSLKIDDPKINELFAQIDYQEKLLDNIATQQVAPISGIITYRVDGNESNFSFDNFDDINFEELENLKIQTGGIISESSKQAKVCSSFNNYIVTISNSKNAKEAKQNQKVELRTTDGTSIDAKIEYLKNVDDNVLLVFSVNTNLEKLLMYRKLSFNLIWWEQTGLKVPNSAILNEDGLNYVIRNRNGYLDKILVNVKKQNQLYSIVDNYSADELKNLGLSQTQIINSKNISIYDEIVVDSQEYDEK